MGHLDQWDQEDLSDQLDLEEQMDLLVDQVAWLDYEVTRELQARQDVME